MWHSTSAGVPVSANAFVSASVTAAFSAGSLDQSAAVSRVSHRAPADSSESRRYGAANRPSSQRPPAPGRQHRAGFGVPALDVLLGALDHGDAQAATGDLAFADRLRGGEIDPGLDLVGEPNDGGAGGILGDGAQGRGPGFEVGERPSLVADGFRDPVHAQPHPGDDADGSLRAAEQAS